MPGERESRTAPVRSHSLVFYVYYVVGVNREPRPPDSNLGSVFAFADHEARTLCTGALKGVDTVISSWIESIVFGLVFGHRVITPNSGFSRARYKSIAVILVIL